MTAYVYRVTHVPTRRHYIGSRGTYSSPLQDIGVHYFTSSKQVSVLLRQSPEQFKIKIVRLFQDRREALAFERKYQLRVNADTNPKFYNKHITGKNGIIKVDIFLPQQLDKRYVKLV